MHHSISNTAFNKILDNVDSNLTIYKLKKKINSIIPFEPQKYDTCKNSCIAFTSLYESLTSCPICNENRFDDDGKPVNTTFFFSFNIKIKKGLKNYNIEILIFKTKKEMRKYMPISSMACE